VTAAEARTGAAHFVDHAMHLTVHGVLHLLGFDHETKRGASVMEPLETRILNELGVADPYATKAA
jgi:probable rRNA maturation factor